MDKEQYASRYEGATQDFIMEFGVELFETLFSVIIGDCEDERIQITDKRSCTGGGGGLGIFGTHGTATITLGERELFVDWQDSNWNGSEIHAYGEDPIKKEYFVSIAKLAIADVNPTEQQKVIFNHWQKAEWFKEMERKISYDFQMSPTNKVMRHWYELARKKGLKIEFESVKTD